MYKIKIETVMAIIEAAKSTYPNEFIGVLGGDKKEKLIDELIIAPAVFGENFSIIHSNMLPFDKKIMGTIHSHPSYSNNPSAHDLNAFSRLGEVHIIISKPYIIDSLRCFNFKGQIVKLKIVE